MQIHRRLLAAMAGAALVGGTVSVIASRPAAANICATRDVCVWTEPPATVTA